MGRKILIICIDAFGPEYLEMSLTPNIDQMIKKGFFTIGQSIVPSVTNVNNVSIITGTTPSIHGITSNYWFDRSTGEGSYMESPDFICCPTVFERAKRLGMSTALLTSKKKLQELLDVGADYSLCAEHPDDEMIRSIGEREDIYSPRINLWLFRALRLVLQERNPDLVYFSTTDGMMHKYAPEEEESIQHVQDMDLLLGRILCDNPDREVYITADHGMSSKIRGIDLKRLLMSKGIGALVVPIIKDRYVAHHQNLGGAAYIYLEKQALVQEALGSLRESLGINEAYPREEASERFELMEDRIGDLLVLGDRDTVFGEFKAVEMPVKVRSHGSYYESAVPIIAYRSKGIVNCRRNFDITSHLGI